MQVRSQPLIRALFVAAALLWGCGDDLGHGQSASLATDAGDASAQRDAASVGDAAQPVDAAAEDAAADASSDSWMPPELTLPEADDAQPFYLSQVGMYRDIERKRLAPDLIAFEPAYKLWSDGADKQRHLRLPPGTQIDSSDIDHWQFPVGTLLFKEFSLAGKRLETRVIARTGPGERDYWMGAFVWNDDESDATFVRDGQADVRGTDHDVPTAKNCLTCHDGDAGRVLGFSAIQQPDVPSEMLSDPPQARVRVPGDAVTAQALGYLHANCGHCHNEDGSARPDTDMILRLSAGARRPEDTATYATTVGIAMQYFKNSPLTVRVAAGDAEHSGLMFRMSQRGEKTQMPPLATEIEDREGIAAVRAWIESL
jgi:hypothetical protein